MQNGPVSRQMYTVCKQGFYISELFVQIYITEHVSEAAAAPLTIKVSGKFPTILAELNNDS